MKVGKGKHSEKVIKAVTEENNIIVNTSASQIENSGKLYLICNPFLRQDPKWMEEKLTQIRYYMYEQFRTYSPVNVASVGEPEILAEDLNPDKVHLNEEGKKKHYAKIVEDLKIGKEELAKFEEEGQEWVSLERLSQRTPMMDQDDNPGEPKKRKEKVLIANINKKELKRK